MPSGYVAGDRVDTGLASELLRSGDAKALFEGPHDVERWDVRSHHGGLDLQHRVFQEPEQGESEDGKKENPPIIGERFAILAVRRGKRILPMSSDYEAKPGDIASIAVHVPDREEA